MIAERIPAIQELSDEEKWQLVAELQGELTSVDPTLQEPLKSEVSAMLEKRWQHYLAHPETAVTLDELTDKIRGLKP